LKKRYIYSFLFGLPGFFASIAISFLVFGAVAGALWLFVFGDNPWPPHTSNLLLIMFVVVFVVSWSAFIVSGYVVGKRLEIEPGFNMRHVFISSGLAFLFIVLITLHQLSVGNALRKTKTAQCSDFCKLNGYAASGVPPRNSGENSCSCYDSNGQEIINVTTGWQ
jgi:uncharacterized membrane protein